MKYFPITSSLIFPPPQLTGHIQILVGICFLKELGLFVYFMFLPVKKCMYELDVIEIHDSKILQQVLLRTCIAHMRIFIQVFVPLLIFL